MDFLQRLESTGFSTWVRESGSLLSFPGILLLHTIGMGVLVGLVLAIDLRILGFAPGFPLAEMRRLFPMIWAAFWLNAATGTVLLVADATTKVTNPDFAIKMLFIVLAVVNLRLIETRVLRTLGVNVAGDVSRTVSALPTRAKMLAVMSMVCWLGAITAGRLLAYVGPVTGLK